MDDRFRYGLGVLLLGLGNLAFGTTQQLFGNQPTYAIVLEIGIGVVLTALGALIVSDPDRVDAEALSSRMLKLIGWAGIVLGVGMIAYAVTLVVTSL